MTWSNLICCFLHRIQSVNPHFFVALYYNGSPYIKVQRLKVFCYHGKKSTILLFYSIFRTPPEISSKLYFVEICQVSEKLRLFNHKRADFWLPNFGFKRSLLSLFKRLEIVHLALMVAIAVNFVS